MNRNLGLVAGLLFLSTSTYFTASARGGDVGVSDDGIWTVVENMPLEVVVAEPWIRPMVGMPLKLDVPKVKELLLDTPLEDTAEAAQRDSYIELPMPDGTFATFRIVESPVMEEALAAQFPEIKTYLGQGVDDPAATVRFDFTPAGFHAQILTPEGAVYIDPYSRGDLEHYTSYWKAEYVKEAPPFICHTVDDEPMVAAPQAGGQFALRSGPTRRTYLVAISATGEFTSFHGGTVSGGLSAVTTIVNRMNGIYEQEFAVRLTLVANNNLIIYTNSATDPFTSPGANPTTLSQNQNSINTAIGSANYDVGHVFHRATNNGVAALSSVCGSSKAQGFSATNPPVGDVFAVDYASHEMGHQFGGRHPFNNCSGNQGDSSTIAVEVGSGSTIMAYAGICGSTNLQANSDPYFHAVNFNQIIAFVGGTTCDDEFATGNTAPTVDAGPGYTIPRSTPFILTATGSDPNGDVLTYCWETTQGGAVVAVNTDNGSSPIIRSRLGTTSPSRMVPPLANLLKNSTPFGEILPTLARTSWIWRVTARDNRAGAGGVNTDDVTITVSGTAGPFQVTSPNTAVSWSGSQTVTWNVASTNVSPVNTANVNIRLSTDGGNTFPTVLASNTPNDGSQVVTLPNISTTTARIKVEAVGNIFFDISNTNFTITFVPPMVTFVASGTNSIFDNSDNGNGNSRLDPGENSISLELGLRNSGTGTATNISTTLTSLTPTATVIGGVSSYPDLPFNASAANNSPFVIDLGSGHPCGQPVVLRLNITSAEGSGMVDYVLPTGLAVMETQTFSYTGPVAPIPDNDPLGVNTAISVSGITGTVTDIDFRIDGSSCSAGIGATTVGIDHTWVGDLVMQLIAPSSFSVTLMDRPGAGPFGSDGNNFCQTLLDDDAIAPSIDLIATGSAPHTGTFTPQNALFSFDGESVSGAWALNVADLSADDTGNVRAWSLIITYSGIECEPPVSPFCIGDADGDGDRDFGDIGAVSASFGATYAPGSAGDGDADNNGVVEFNDYAIVLANFGIPCP